MQNRAHILDRAVVILMANYINIICRFRRCALSLSLSLSLARARARALCVDKLLRTDERARLRPLSTPYGFSRWAIAHFAVQTANRWRWKDEASGIRWRAKENIPAVRTFVASAHARGDTWTNVRGARSPWHIPAGLP